MGRGCCSCFRCSIASLVIGVLLICAALVVQLAIIPMIFDRSLEIRNGSVQYKNWYNPEVPVYMQWYVFNLTNVENVTAKTEKPQFVQHGPYTYREHRVKVNITWHDNGTVTYKNLRWWTFLPEMSNGTEDDLIYSVNLPLVTVAESLRYEPLLVKFGFSVLAASFDETLYKNYTMHQLIWGYHDPMMKAAMGLLHDWFYTDFVGVYAGKNYTDDGVWTVNTGQNNITEVGRTVAYNGSQYLSFWSTKYANMVNGTDGTISQPGLKKSQNIQLFIPDVCRSMYAVYCEDEKTNEGITLHRYSSPREELKNATGNPDNAGFCTPPGNCLLGDGIMNLTVCQTLDHINIPVMVSLPHFLYADPKYLDAVGGLSPVESEHRTDIAVEPRTGLVMRLAKRLQINFYLRPVEYISVLSGIDEIIFPVAWLNESAQIDNKNEDVFLSMMQLLNVANILCYVVYGCATLMTLSSAGYIVYYSTQKNKRRSGEGEPLLGGGKRDDSGGGYGGASGADADDNQFDNKSVNRGAHEDPTHSSDDG